MYSLYVLYQQKYWFFPYPPNYNALFLKKKHNKNKFKSKREVTHCEQSHLNKSMRKYSFILNKNH